MSAWLEALASLGMVDRDSGGSYVLAPASTHGASETP